MRLVESVAKDQRDEGEEKEERKGEKRDDIAEEEGEGIRMPASIEPLVKQFGRGEFRKPKSGQYATLVQPSIITISISDLSKS